jgi:hypothetical protein
MADSFGIKKGQAAFSSLASQALNEIGERSSAAGAEGFNATVAVLDQTCDGQGVTGRAVSLSIINRRFHFASLSDLVTEPTFI